MARILEYALRSIAMAVLIGCDSKIEIGEYPLNEIHEDTCSGLKAVSIKFRSSSYEGVFLAKDTSNVKWDDMIFKVNGYVRSAKWTGCRNLEIKSEGHFKLFEEEVYLDEGGEKYPGLKVDLFHRQW